MKKFLILFILLFFIGNVAAASIGGARMICDNYVLNNDTSGKFKFYVTNSNNQDQIFQIIEQEGDLVFSENEFEIEATKAVAINGKVNAKNQDIGEYEASFIVKGKKDVEATNGSAISVSMEITIPYTVADKANLSTKFNMKPTEVGHPLTIEETITNNTSEKVERVTLLMQLIDSNGDVVEEKNEVKNFIPGTTNIKWEIDTKDFMPEEYKVKVLIEDKCHIYAEFEETAEINPPGTTIPVGNIVTVSAPGSATEDEKILIKTKFNNESNFEIPATLKVDVYDLEGNLVKTDSSRQVTLDTKGETEIDIETFISEPGDYVVKSSILYGNLASEELESKITVSKKIEKQVVETVNKETIEDKKEDTVTPEIVQAKEEKTAYNIMNLLILIVALIALVLIGTLLLKKEEEKKDKKKPEEKVVEEKPEDKKKEETKKDEPEIVKEVEKIPVVNKSETKKDTKKAKKVKKKESKKAKKKK